MARFCGLLLSLASVAVVSAENYTKFNCATGEVGECVPTKRYQCLTGNPETTPSDVPRGLRIAFLADQGMDPNAKSLMRYLKTQNIELLLHGGDISYDSGAYGPQPASWLSQVYSTLGNIPVITAVGNHDSGEHAPGWGIEQTYEAAYTLASKLGTCKGESGVEMVCTFRGITMVFTAPGVFGGKYGDFIEKAFRKYPSRWRMCVWHKNMRLMQTGAKGNEAGWETYEACRRMGAMVYTGHEHQYARTFEMKSISRQIVSNTQKNTRTNPITLREEDTANRVFGTTVVTLNGAGGHNVKNASALANYPWWAVKASGSVGFNTGGAVICDFNPNGQQDEANCQYHDVYGVVWDDYWVKSAVDPAQSLSQFPIKSIQIQLSRGADDGQDFGVPRCDVGWTSMGGLPSLFKFRNVPLRAADANRLLSAKLKFSVQSHPLNHNATNLLFQVEQPLSSSVYRDVCSVGYNQRGWMPRQVEWKAVRPWAVGLAEQDKNASAVAEGSVVTSPDLTAILGTLLRDSNWKENSDLTIGVTGTGSRSVVAFDGLSSGVCSAPVLQVELYDQRTSCWPLTPPANGKVFVSNGGFYPAVAEFSCNPGFQLTGPTLRQCLSFGNWDGASPTCQKLPACPTFKTTLSNGLVQASRLNLAGSILNYTCNKGYNLRPDKDYARYCIEGSWQPPSEPTCERGLALTQSPTPSPLSWCCSSQAQHGVSLDAQGSWGTLPFNLRLQWANLDCSNLIVAPGCASIASSDKGKQCNATTPCECAKINNCGWDSGSDQCVEAEETDCLECPTQQQCSEKPNQVQWPPAGVSRCQAECTCSADPVYCCQDSATLWDDQCNAYALKSCTQCPNATAAPTAAPTPAPTSGAAVASATVSPTPTSSNSTATATTGGLVCKPKDPNATNLDCRNCVGYDKLGNEEQCKFVELAKMCMTSLNVPCVVKKKADGSANTEGYSLYGEFNYAYYQDLANGNSSSGSSKAPTAAPTASAAATPSCSGKKDVASNCATLPNGKSFCRKGSQYYSWMMENCGAFCCQCCSADSASDGEDQCKGKRNVGLNCDTISTKYCTDPAYDKWMETNCDQYCCQSGVAFGAATKSPTATAAASTAASNPTPAATSTDSSSSSSSRHRDPHTTLYASLIHYWGAGVCGNRVWSSC
mmetsp:Transcript_25178/g.49555  ORF Transcript_25178/g.49555 Transcript_25178/m.49555 type:complete len:1154 (-) Transcript_25178:172-3633(-)